MNLENFLEKDIIEFLEEKEKNVSQKKEEIVEEKEEFSTHKDYASLFQNALDVRDMQTAKNIFREIQTKVANAKTQIEHESYTELMESMFTQMQVIKEKSKDDKGFVKEIEDMKYYNDKLSIKR